MASRWMFFAVFSWLGLSLVAAPGRADVRAHRLFSDHAVLQQGAKTSVFGFADGEEQVTVKFQGQEVSTKAKDGRWLVQIENLKADTQPAELLIKGEKNTLVIRDVLVGEVWIGGGQSNMQWSVDQSAEADQVKAAARNDSVRLLEVPRHAAGQPEADLPDGTTWQLCTAESVGGFSAVLYHFGRELNGHLKIPCGLISSNWGGTVGEAWTSRESLAAHPEFNAAFLTAPIDPKNANSPTVLYNAMIHPLLPCGIRGVVWYQGESNAARAWQYRTLFPTMIADWRKGFGQGDFPFLFVQLAPYHEPASEPGESNWAELREAQLLTSLKVPKTAMAVITDFGEKDIHPQQKAPVGQRLALAARAVAYGESIEYTGPLFESLSVDGERAIVKFRNTGGALAARGGELTGFTVCGEDHKFRKAQARIDGESVVVTCLEVPRPIAVRFGWDIFPVANLYSVGGLPASPFRTDDFPLTTQPK